MTADSLVSRRRGARDEHANDPLLIAACRRQAGMDANSYVSFQTKSLRAEWDAGQGILILDVALLDQPVQLVVGGWDRGVGWALNHDGTAEMMPTDWDPGLQMLSPANEWAQPWRQQIPEPVLAALRKFPADYWPMLCWASRYRDAQDLLLSEPKLLWLLLRSARERQWPASRIRLSLHMKRRRILGRSGFHEANTTLRFIKKLAFKCYGSPEFELLKPWLCNPVRMARLRHYPTISEQQLRFIEKIPYLAESVLVRCPGAEPDYFKQVARWTEDTHNLAWVLGGREFSRRFRRCRNLTELRALHDRLTDQFIHAAPPQSAQRSYPQEPIPGNEFIVPITNYEELAWESRMQRHCIQIYHKRIVAGEYYVYRVLKPERATLGMYLNGRARPRLDQIQLKFNEPVAQETEDAVEAWINSYDPTAFSRNN
ncbi:MAG: hypothetical protein FIA97_15090 [Methylococcaceae bacterium]|nr:hypothetical protein [Methylococcaceae bacterium]